MPFLYRGHFAFLRNPRMTASGINTSPLLGFLNALVAIIRDYHPTHLVIAADSTGPTFRHTAYAPYKQQRDKMPEDIAAAIGYSLEFAAALHIPVVRCEGFEADDVIGTLSRMADAAGFETFLATPDKDAAQLVTANVKLFRTVPGGTSAEILGVDEVVTHWHLSSPAQMIDYLALAGDASDNIPGIRGVGEKTAQQLLAQYGTVENIVANAASLKGKLAEKVAAGAEDAKISKFLTTIRTDVPLTITLDELARQPFDTAALTALCARFELATLASRLDINSATTEEQIQPANLDTCMTVPHQYTLVNSDEAAAALAAELANYQRIAFDTECSSLNPHKAFIVGMSFAVAKGRAWYVALPPQDEAARRRIAFFAPLFADNVKTFIAHNGKFDRTLLERYGVHFARAAHDTLLAHSICNSAVRHSMDALSRELLHYDPIPITKLIGEKKRGTEQLSMAELSPEEICDYAAEDADVTFQLEEIVRTKVKEYGALNLLEQCEEPLTEVLIAMEREGVKIDVEALHKFGHELERELLTLTQRIRAYGDPGLNIDSPKQLGALLFDKLQLGRANAKKTSTGQYSTDEKTLSKMVGEHPIIKDILDYRACSKLKGTYADKLPQCIDSDGRVHTTFAQALTETGRLSSSDPNLQNIPVRTDRGKLIRAAFVARDENHVLLSADYSQIELRLIAAMSGDETMLEAFRNGADIHRETAARVYDIMPELVTDSMRAACKQVNFGIIYGISAFGLSQRVPGLARRDAQKLIDQYFALYPKIRAFIDSCIAKARETGYAVTLMGRRRYLRDITSRNATIRQAAEREAVNTPVQGTAAELIKCSMVAVHKALREANLQTKMILQIHDELLFDVPLNELEQVKPLVRNAMEHAMELPVPLAVSIGTAPNWLAAH